MKKQWNKLTSSVLVLLLLFSAVAGLLPVRASAAHTNAADRPDPISSEELDMIFERTYEESFDDAQSRLEFEREMPIIGNCLVGVTSKDGRYSIFVNRYTGMLYYRNNLTGRILTSNPYNYTDVSEATTRDELLSQICIEFKRSDTLGSSKTYYSATEAAKRGQLELSVIDNGIRVHYTLGDTTTRFFFAGRISVETFESVFVVPMLTNFYEGLESMIGAAALNFLDYRYTQEEIEAWSVSGAVPAYLAFVDGSLNTSSASLTRNYSDGRGNKGRVVIPAGLKAYLKNMMKLAQTEAEKIYGKGAAMKDERYAALFEIQTDLIRLIQNYGLVNVNAYADQPAQESTYGNLIETYYSDKTMEISKTLEPFYIYTGSTQKLNTLRIDSALFRKYVDEYTNSNEDGDTLTIDMILEEEEKFGYEYDAPISPVFRCALEYTFAADSSLLVRLPANSISFDEKQYTLVSISPMQHFGAGAMQEDGYLFFPDGSGTVIAFQDFRNAGAISGSGNVYGSDYCYSRDSEYVTGNVHHEQVTVPVYGVSTVTGVEAAAKKIGSVSGDKAAIGYFAVMEEGASLASLYYRSGGVAHSYANVYAEYNPYPSDSVNLSGAGGNSTYTIVSESKYSGSYVTRYTMLCDDETLAFLGGASEKYYPATYTGMANCYRDYLSAVGVLPTLTDLTADIPLYIESLGSMEINAKFLTFPITKKIALTSFEDVQAMYSELSAQGVRNINFRLTGFANDGMYYTYPSRVRWERSVGGRRGFRELISAAAEISAQEDRSFGVYPDFDFLYIHNQAAFDGIVLKGNVARRVDNRYASRYTEAEETAKGRVLVISPDVLDKLYGKFAKQYAKYDVKTLSISSIASDLNSNFDEDQSVNRDEAQGYVEALLARISDEGYTLMSDTGNIYAVRYVRHLLNVSTDSSHFRYSSYPIPFLGMVLHGSVSYAGEPINYAGTPAYELLRAIESGASLYYILCYNNENTAKMKDDNALSTYYGVDYSTWEKSIVETYNELNGLLKDYQTWNITGHEIILGERVIEASETAANYDRLKEEFLAQVEATIEEKIDAWYDEARRAKEEDGSLPTPHLVAPAGDAIVSEMVDRFAAIYSLTEEQKGSAEAPGSVLDAAFREKLSDLFLGYRAEYAGSENDPEHNEELLFGADDIAYTSRYSFVTVSDALDGKSYVTTDYTSDLNNIVLVTYSNGTDSVRFILNYNIYDVDVRLDGQLYTIPMFGYRQIKD